MPFLSAFSSFFGCTQCYNQSPLALLRFNLPIRGANTEQPHSHPLADTTLPMLAQIQHTQPLLFNKPSPSVSKAERPSQSPFAGPGCSERRHQVEEHERPAPTACGAEATCTKANIKGMAGRPKAPKHHTFRSVFYAGRLEHLSALLYGCGGCLMHALAGCLHRLHRPHNRPQIHTLHCTKKGTKPMPCPP